MEQFSQRTVALIGEQSFEKLKNSDVLIVGLGGVGGFVAEFLARAGISSFTLVDGDKVEKTNLNRQIIATQDMRQDAYDRKTTTDDHGMHIFGLAQDQNGTKYFMVKNSWGETGKYKGIWYASDAFVRYKTMNIVVHKDALPKDIKKKLGIK